MFEDIQGSLKKKIDGVIIDADIAWTDADLLLIGPLGIYWIFFHKICVGKYSLLKEFPICSDLCVLI